MSKPEQHSSNTKLLARALSASDVFDWLVTAGYFPESYVLPPCFSVLKRQPYGHRYFPPRPQYQPEIAELEEIHFPKSTLADRTFGIIEPRIHNEIAHEIADNWSEILDILFHPNKTVHSYSFPIPVTTGKVGQIGKLRAGRMIYEFIEMAESDLVEEAFQYRYLVNTDIKNFYPSVYTHSLAWAIHGKSYIRNGSNRHDGLLFGNRIDKLFQNANEGCTNGLPIGPAVSDLITEVLLSAIDTDFSRSISSLDILCVRFKDDYRILCKDENDCKKVIKSLQKSLKKYNLQLNEDKTVVKSLPEGLFRTWVSRYHHIRPKKNEELSFREFREIYLGVLRIDQECPGTGIIDRFITDLTDDDYKPLIPVKKMPLKKAVSLLFLLAERRTKAFPRILGFIEGLMNESNDDSVRRHIEEHLNNYLQSMFIDWEQNRYVISWIFYFLKGHGMKVRVRKKAQDNIIESVRSNHQAIFTGTSDFKLFKRINKSGSNVSLSEILDVFEPK